MLIANARLSRNFFIFAKALGRESGACVGGHGIYVEKYPPNVNKLVRGVR